MCLIEKNAQNKLNIMKKNLKIKNSPKIRLHFLQVKYNYLFFVFDFGVAYVPGHVPARFHQFHSHVNSFLSLYAGLSVLYAVMKAMP